MMSVGRSVTKCITTKPMHPTAKVSQQVNRKCPQEHNLTTFNPASIQSPQTLTPPNLDKQSAINVNLIL